MKHKFFTVSALAACLLAGSTFLNAESKSPVSDSNISRNLIAEAPPATKGIVDANTSVGMDLLHKLSAEKPNQNLFISPLSIGTCFGMAYAGASGSTQQAMQKVLHYPSSGADSISKSYNALLKALTDPNSKVQVEIANAIFCRQAVKLEDQFVSSVKTYFQSEVTSLDFAAPDTLGKINGWVSTKTHGKIPSIISKIDPTLMSILINAAYFKGQWAHTFYKEATKPADFHLIGGKSKKVPMMHDSRHFEYYQGAKLQAVALPYEEFRYNAYIFLPSKDSSLAELQKTLSANTWNSWLAKFESRKGDVALPRFKVEYTTSLSKALQGLGMSVAFDMEKADFSAMHKGQPKFFIGDVIHKTFLKVDEFGTEAAAVTAIEMAGAGMMPPETPFNMVVDRPFIFAIKDNETSSLMFIGCIYDPDKI